MTQYRTNAAGEQVRYDKNTDRWVPVKHREKKDTAETSQPAPEGETVVSEGDTTPRRARDDA